MAVESLAGSLSSYLSASCQSPFESPSPWQQSSQALWGNIWTPLDCSLVLVQPTLPPHTPCGKRSCEIRERKASQGAANEFGVICQLHFDAPVFPFLLCSKPFWSLPAVPHSSSVLLLTRTMHPINKGLCIRTFKKPQKSPKLSH